MPHENCNNHNKRMILKGFISMFFINVFFVNIIKYSNHLESGFIVKFFFCILFGLSPYFFWLNFQALAESCGGDMRVVGNAWLGVQGTLSVETPRSK